MPQFDSAPQIDDVSRLNAVDVMAIFQCRTIEDVVWVVENARLCQRKVVVRGTSHSMGGHAVCRDAFVIDMAKMRSLAYDEDEKIVTVGAGAKWYDVIRFLNEYGMSPRTMQSYSSFSVGGSISVNAHGVTTDHCLAESVVSFKIVTHEGKVISCRPDSDVLEERELFSLAIGGFGLFGIITEVSMKVSINTHLEMISLLVDSKDFLFHYDHALENENIEIKLARLDLRDLSQIDLFLFRKSLPGKTISNLPIAPRKMSSTARLMYKWFAPTIKELRFAIEHQVGVALDWDSNNSKERNVLMFESAEPLARLFEPIFRTDDTFILQEYFVPKQSFHAWIEMAKPIIKELNELGNTSTICTLLNITIRYVKKDETTFLKYASEESFAFVLYFRIHRSEEGDQCVRQIHEKLVQGTLKLNGKFFLPYRHHYSKDELKEAYPDIDEFWEKKSIYDPTCIFDNMWRSEYGPSVETNEPKESPLPSLSCENPDYVVREVSQRRTNSFRKIMDSPNSSKLLRDGFLQFIFNLENSSYLYRTIIKVCWDVRNKNDDEIYTALQEELKLNSTALGEITKLWKSITQLRDQKEEISRESVGILGRLGKIGHIKDYVSIGDHGKMVLSFKEKLHVDGTITIVHDENSNEIPVVLERGSDGPIGEFLKINYESPTLNMIPEQSADLITLNQGLHHLPQSHLKDFLKDVYRILRPGGIFIVREHDCDPENHPELLPMLDMAHMVFNAVTGVSSRAERLERRGFRSILEWRQIISSVGLCDSMLYDMQENDPTWDEMMCFYKPPLWPEGIIKPMRNIQTKINNKAPIERNIDEIPDVLLSEIKDMIRGLNDTVNSLSSTLKTNTSLLSPGQKFVVDNFLDTIIEPTKILLARFIPLLDNVQIQDEISFTNIIPPEFTLMINAIVSKAEKGKATPIEMIIVSLIKDFESSANISQDIKPKIERPEVAKQDIANEEIETILVDLFENIPELKNGETINSLGFNFITTRAAISFHSSLDFDSGDLSKVTQFIVDKVDRESWDILKTALVEISVSQTLPTLENCTTPSNSWYNALYAIFSSSKINISGSVLRKLSTFGLDEISALYRKAKANRLPRTNSKYQREITHILDSIHKGEPIEIKMEEGQFKTIENVYEIISAEYGFESATVDVIDTIQKLYLSGNTLSLDTKDITRDLKNEGLLEFRLMDMLHNITGKKRHLLIKYCPIKEFDSQTSEKRLSEIKNYLINEGWIAENNATEVTWYKLVEWLLVDMVQHFGASMEHSPWYRFPFFEYVEDYMSILAKEFMIVSKKHGWNKALLSPGLLISFLPGVFMTFILTQLQVIAIPLKKVAGTKYQEERTVEHITIYVNELDKKFSEINSKITEEIQITNNLYSIAVPTFKELTNILVDISEKIPGAYIVDISGSHEVQMKVKFISDKLDIESIVKAVPDGCRYLFDFSQSMDLNHERKKYESIAFGVTVPALLKTMRMLKSLDSNIEIQVFDFYI